MADQEKVGRTGPEHNERMPVEPVGQAPPQRTRQILAHGQSRNVANAPPLQIPGRGVMNGVPLAPERIRRQRQNAQRPPEHVIRVPRFEKRTMAAIVLNHEEPHQQRRGRHNKDHRRPDAMIDAEKECRRQSQERKHRAGNLHDGSTSNGVGTMSRQAPLRCAEPRPAATPCFGPLLRADKATWLSII